MRLDHTLKLIFFLAGINNKVILIVMSIAVLATPVYAWKSLPVSKKQVDAPLDQDVCFSPDENCDFKLLKFIQSAKKSIDIAIYDINLDQLVHELLIKSKKIRVRVIADRRQSKGPHSLIPLLLKAGASVRYGHQKGIFHNKFTVVDGRMIETGSFNYTNHASKSNNENQVYLCEPKIVQRFHNQFESLWSKSDAVSGKGLSR